jgi:glycosyltransferase involved in cell wall biosynthesis
LQSIRFIEISDEVGGEDIWLRRISSLYGTEPIVFWKKNSPFLGFRNKGINRILNSFVKVSCRLNYRMGRGIFLNLLIYASKLDTFDGVTFFSTTYVPIPRGANIVSYIHTPSRRMTVDFEDLKKFEKNRSRLKFLIILVFRFFYRTVYSMSLDHSQINLSNSQNVRERTLQFTGRESIVVYPTQNVSEFYNLGYGNYFLYVSRLERYKRQDYAIRAFKLFQENVKNFNLILISPSPRTYEENEYYEELLSLIKSESLDVTFEFDLTRSEVIQKYANAFACLFTAKNEDLGQIPIESMSAEKPIIAINDKGPSETIIDGITGFLVSNEKEMAEKMIFLVNHPDIAEKMGKSGRIRALEYFDDSVFKARLDEIINYFSK